MPTSNLDPNRSSATVLVCDGANITGRVFFDDGFFVALRSDFDFVVDRY